MRDFPRAWATGCRLPGFPGLLKHDLRRSTMRQMVNRGIPQRVAMTLTGHKTRSCSARLETLRASG